MPWNTGTVFHTEFTQTKVKPRLEGVRYVAGLDVAQQHDWTALAVLELIPMSSLGIGKHQLKQLGRYRNVGLFFLIVLQPAATMPTKTLAAVGTPKIPFPFELAHFDLDAGIF